MASDSSTPIRPIPPRYVGLTNAETFGRLRSRPDAIEPTAAAYFAEWAGGVPAELEIASGDASSGAPGSVLSAPLVVKVTDGTGNPIAGVPVTFQVRELDARIDGRIAITAVTGADGRATAGRWRLGRGLGTQHVDATVLGTKTTFTARVTAPEDYPQPGRASSTAKSPGSRTS
jgi:hypothetical protein